MSISFASTSHSSYGSIDDSSPDLQSKIHAMKTNSYRAIALELLNVMATQYHHQCLDMDFHNGHTYYFDFTTFERLPPPEENFQNLPGMSAQTLSAISMLDETTGQWLNHEESLRHPNVLKEIEEAKKKPVYFPDRFSRLFPNKDHQYTVKKIGRLIKNLLKCPKSIKEGFFFSGPAMVKGQFYIGSDHALKIRFLNGKECLAGEGEYDVKELTERDQIKNIVGREYVIKAPAEDSMSEFCNCVLS